MIAALSTAEKVQGYNLKDTYEVFAEGDVSAVINKIKIATHYNYILIDLDDHITSTDAEIQQALYLFTRMNNAPVIVIAQNRGIGDVLLSDLIKMGVYNIVVSSEAEVFENDLQRAFTGLNYDDVKQFVIKTDDEQGPIKEKIFISIAGCCSRIGTTTQAIRLTRYYMEQGHKACYIELNKTGHLALLEQLYSESSKENETVIYEGIPMYYNVPDENYDYVICDFGTEKPPKDMNFEVEVYIGGTTPYELSSFASLLQEIDVKPTSRFIFSFTSIANRDDVQEFMETMWHSTYFAEYTPDMFSALKAEERTMYKDLADKRNELFI